ncbi:MAG: protein kinase [Bryobacter sp.]|nr:protein kinase [Bryobacter sp.]
MTPGAYLGPYRILDPIGEGGMGVVYRAADDRLGRELALKVLRPSRRNDAERRRRFSKEARAASALNHPNIVTIYDIGREGDTDYIAMELVRGQTVRARMRAEGLPLNEIVAVASGVATALEAAHAAGIVHRDLKPGNVMVTDQGLVKVLDFGLAKLVGGPPSSDGTSEEGVILGTVAYMSPEQTQGRDVDGRSDIFSLGTLIFEMAAGSPPFPTGSPLVQMQAILSRPAPPLRSIRPDLPEALEQVLARALEKLPARRFQTMGEFRSALAGLEDTGRSTSAGYVPATPALAVLPFRGLSPGEEDDYFADGLSEDLITALSQVRGLRVVARSSSFRFRDPGVDLREVGRQLNVSAVLEGSVRLAAGQLRVTAQLVGIADAAPLWSGRYDRRLTDLFAVQDELTQAIVTALRGHLSSDAALRLRPGGTPNFEAYQMLVRARHHWFQWTPDGFRKCEEFLARALALDPNYALAWNLLSDCHHMCAIWGLAPPLERGPLARQAARRALEIAPELTEAHTALAAALAVFDWDYPAAELEFRRAIELNPHDPTTYHAWAMVFLCPQGRTQEAITALEQARRLDPLSPVYSVHLGWAWHFLRDYAQAEACYRNALELDPAFPEAVRSQAWLESDRGNHVAALELFDRAQVLAGAASHLLADHGRALARAGRLDAARDLLEELDSRRAATYVPPVYDAVILASLGDLDPAFDWMDRAVRERSTALSLLRVDPRFDPLRADPRFPALLSLAHLATPAD